MSLNELIKAEKLGAIYKIYRVVKSQDGYIMHILSNPIQRLSIDVGLLKAGYENDYAQINATAFKVSLKEKMLDNITSLKITQEELV